MAKLSSLDLLCMYCFLSISMLQLAWVSFYPCASMSLIAFVAIVFYNLLSLCGAFGLDDCVLPGEKRH
uniref:Uncharacterized protein n=1 Tax=Manihot esculenta TaxID=3983 RepID=A0A199UBL5_MANES